VIVRPSAAGLQVITQPDHAHLSGRLMAYSGTLRAHPRRDSILLAVAEHDNGWEEEDAAPTVDPATGAIVDFINAPLGVRHRVWPRAVARLAHDPWAAALVAQHALAVYERYRPAPDWTSHFSGMEAARDAWLDRMGARLDDLLADYRFVRLADLISLAFCAGWTDAHSAGTWTVQVSDTCVVVSPDAFGGTRVPIEVEARTIRRGPFGSDAELRDALRMAPRHTLRGEVAGEQP
jgi:hypothetical protein